MKPELYEEVELICSVPAAELEVGDRAILIDYLEDPNGGEMGAVLELSQSQPRDQYVVTVPVGAISSPLCEAVATLDATAHSLERPQETPAKASALWSVFQKILNFVAKFTVFLDLGTKRR